MRRNGQSAGESQCVSVAEWFGLSDFKTFITDGLFSLSNWLVINSGIGVLHATPVTWLCSHLGQFEYVIGVGSLLIAFRTRKYWKQRLCSTMP